MNAEYPKDAVNNAVPVTFGEDEYVCPKCKNKGVLWYVADNEVKAKQCDCREMRETHRLIRASGLGSALKEKRFDNFKVTNKHQDNLKKNAQAYLGNLLNGGKEWLIVCGQSGSGKTHICTALAGALLDKKYSVYYMLWREQADLLTRFSKSAAETDEQDALFEKIKSADVLYIDDYLKTDKGENGALDRPKKWDLELAFKIINAREFVRKPTIISTEWTIDELNEIDEATTGRMYLNAGRKAIIIPRSIENNYRMVGGSGG